MRAVEEAREEDNIYSGNEFITSEGVQAFADILADVREKRAELVAEQSGMPEEEVYVGNPTLFPFRLNSERLEVLEELADLFGIKEQLEFDK